MKTTADGDADGHHLAGLAVDEAVVGAVHGEHDLGTRLEPQDFGREQVLFEEVDLVLRPPGFRLADGFGAGKFAETEVVPAVHHRVVGEEPGDVPGWGRWLMRGRSRRSVSPSISPRRNLAKRRHEIRFVLPHDPPQFDGLESCRLPRRRIEGPVVGMRRVGSDGRQLQEVTGADHLDAAEGPFVVTDFPAVEIEIVERVPESIEISSITSRLQRRTRLKATRTLGFGVPGQLGKELLEILSFGRTEQHSAPTVDGHAADVEGGHSG